MYLKIDNNNYLILPIGTSMARIRLQSSLEIGEAIEKFSTIFPKFHFITITLKVLLHYSFSIIRKYLLNVVNTVNPNSVVKAVISIRNKREETGIDIKPIKVTNEFAKLLSEFISISNDQKRRGLRIS